MAAARSCLCACFRHLPVTASARRMICNSSMAKRKITGRAWNSTNPAHSLNTCPAPSLAGAPRTRPRPTPGGSTLTTDLHHPLRVVLLHVAKLQPSRRRLPWQVWPLRWLGLGQHMPGIKQICTPNSTAFALILTKAGAGESSTCQPVPACKLARLLAIALSPPPAASNVARHSSQRPAPGHRLAPLERHLPRRARLWLHCAIL